MKKLLSILFIALSIHVFGQDPLTLSQQLTTAIQTEQATIAKLNALNQGQTASITILNIRLTAANKTIDSCKAVIIKLTNAGTGPIVVTPPPTGDSFTPYVPVRDVSTLPVTVITWAQLQALKSTSGKNYQLASGTYSSGQANLTDCYNIFLDLSLAKFTGNTMPFFELKGFCHHITFSKANVSKGGSQFISYQFPKAYNPNDLTTVPGNLTIQDGSFDQQGGYVFQNGGMLNSTGMIGVIKNLKFIYNKVTNSPNIQNIVWGYNLEGFIFANNTFDNINSATINHNGLFQVSGNGICVNNIGTNSEGSMMRLNPFLVTGENTTSLIQNNIYVSTIKYGAFEVQIVPEQKSYVKSLSSILVDHNTAGNLGTVGRGTTAQWNSALIDIYPVGSAVVNVTNNLGFNMYLTFTSTIPQNMIDPVNTEGDTINSSNNFYYTTLPQAVVDGVSYKSRFVGIGAQ